MYRLLNQLYTCKMFIRTTPAPSICEQIPVQVTKNLQSSLLWTAISPTIPCSAMIARARSKGVSQFPSEFPHCRLCFLWWWCRTKTPFFAVHLLCRNCHRKMSCFPAECILGTFLRHTGGRSTVKSSSCCISLFFPVFSYQLPSRKLLKSSCGWRLYFGVWTLADHKSL